MLTKINPQELTSKKCTACEGEGEKIIPEEAQQLLTALSGWRLTDEGRRIRKDWRIDDFHSGIAFFEQVADLADSEGHHPDLHLEGYHNLWIELSTHSIGGLSENDFILAAKIDQLKR